MCTLVCVCVRAQSLLRDVSRGREEWSEEKQNREVGLAFERGKSI